MHGRHHGLGLRSALFVLALSGLCSATNGVGLLGRTLIEAGESPDRLYLAGSYGLLTSSDAGASWHYVCESAFTGRSPLHSEPMLVHFLDGTLLAGVRGGTLASSGEDACSFAPGSGLSSDTQVIDLALQRTDERRAVALTQSPLSSASDGHAVRLAWTEDGGASWSLGEAIEGFMGALSLVAAPSDPERLYLTGFSSDLGVALLSSDDGGASFTRHEVPEATLTSPPRLLAIDPNDADVAYLVVDGWEPWEDDANFLMASDTLLRTDNAGADWEILVQERAKLLDMTFSPDGETALFAFGDPQLAYNQLVTSDDVGLYSTPSAGGDFQKLLGASLSCVTWGRRGIYVCPVSWANRMLALFDGPTLDTLDSNAFLPLLSFGQVSGPLGCGNIGAQCAEAWTQGVPPQLPACRTIGRCEDTGGSSDTGGASGVGGDNGDGSAGREGQGGEGGGGEPGGGEAGQADGGKGPSNPRQGAATGSSACRCHLQGQSRPPRASAAFLCGSFIAASLRRRKQAGRWARALLRQSP